MLALFDITCVAFLLSLIFTPIVRDLSMRSGLVDQPDGGRKLHGVSIARIGGIAVVAAYVLSLAFVLFAPYHNLNIDVDAGTAAAIALTPAAAIVFATGLVDDIRGLKPWHKILAEIVAAVLAYKAGFGVYFLHGHPLGEWISLPISVLWLVGCTNALNLIDGIDGLAAGVGVFATLTSFIAALIHGNLELAFVTAPLAGALLGFLRYNFNPASIFLGDSGSLFIGFLLGCFGTMWGQKSATAVGMTAPLIALAMPLLDTALAIVRRFLRARPIFGADRAHIHHRLLDQGLTPRRAALILYGFCGLCAVLALLQDVAHKGYGGVIVILFCAAAWIGVQHLGYAEFGITSRLLLKGSLRGMIDVQLRLQDFERTLRQAKTFEQLCRLAQAAATEFGLAGLEIGTARGRFESVTEVDSGRMWQLIVPLEKDAEAIFYFDSTRTIQPLVLSLFPRYLTACLQPYLDSSAAESAPAFRAKGEGNQAVAGLTGLPSEVG